MGTPADDFLGAIEVHSVAGVRGALDAGLDPRAVIRGRTPDDWLCAMYTRSDRFPACLQALLERGAELSDPRLVPVLLDDGEAVATALRQAPELLAWRATLESAFTPLIGAPLLHVAAEFGNRSALRALLDAGAPVDGCAARDEYGLDGHTALFHAVNTNGNRGAPIMRTLIEAGARPDVRLTGIVWGRGFEWETTFYDVTPISYAQLGTLPQMHRDERDTTENVRYLVAAAGRAVPPLANVPNQYLRSS